MTNKNKNYVRGRNAEQYVVNLLKEKGYQAFRVPGSGGVAKNYLPDVIAGHPGSNEMNIHRIIVEVKCTKKEYKYISNKSLKELDAFAYAFDAIPAVCINFNRSYLWWIPLYPHEQTQKMRRFDKERGMTFDTYLKKEARL